MQDTTTSRTAATSLGTEVGDRPAWSRTDVEALLDLPFPELIFRAPKRSPAAFRPARGANFDPAVDQDRRLPGGLRLLSAKRAV